MAPATSYHIFGHRLHRPRRDHFLALISCRRMGILSIARLSARKSHGNGLRSLTCPSFPISKSVNPRGRNFWRSRLSIAGSESVKTTISRSVKAAGSIFRYSIWVCSRTSSFELAKTTIKRFCHANVFRSVSDVTGWNRSACSSANPMAAVTYNSVAKIKCFIRTPFVLDIVQPKAFAKGFAVKQKKNFTNWAAAPSLQTR